MLSPTYKCEECNMEKGEGNRWLELRNTVTGAPYFVEWTEEAENPDTKHICGEECAHKVLGKHLTALREVAREVVAI